MNHKAPVAIDERQTARIGARYDRIAPVYDLMEALPERQFSDWREKLWAQVPEGRVLEVGVGTGKNFPHRAGDRRIVPDRQWAKWRGCVFCGG